MCLCLGGKRPCLLESRGAHERPAHSGHCRRPHAGIQISSFGKLREYLSATHFLNFPRVHFRAERLVLEVSPSCRPEEPLPESCSLPEPHGRWEEGWPVTVVQGPACELASGFRVPGAASSCGAAVDRLLPPCRWTTTSGAQTPGGRVLCFLGVWLSLSCCEGKRVPLVSHTGSPRALVSDAQVRREDGSSETLSWGGHKQQVHL